MCGLSESVLRASVNSFNLYGDCNLVKVRSGVEVSRVIELLCMKWEGYAI